MARLSWKPHCFIRLHLKRRTVQLTCSKHSRNFSQTFQQGGTDQLTFLKLFKVNHIHIFSLKNWEMAILKISSVVFQKLYGLFEKWGESSWLKVTDMPAVLADCLLLLTALAVKNRQHFPLRTIEKLWLCYLHQCLASANNPNLSLHNSHPLIPVIC